VLLERRARLLDARVHRLQLEGRSEQLGDLGDLVRVAGGEDGLHRTAVRRGGGGSATNSSWRAKISVSPSSASWSSVSSSLRLNGAPSAVPWTSTYRPADVMTTFMSTSARESSAYGR